MNIFVSNLGPGVQTEDLENIFKPYGIIGSINLVMDRITNTSRGFAFIQMVNTQEAERAMHELNGSMMDGRSIKMNEARQKQQRSLGTGFY